MDWTSVLVLRLLRSVALALLVLIEPLLRFLLLPLAHGFFAMAVLFGLLLHAPRFPTWGMMGLAIGLLWMYGLCVAGMLWLQGGQRRA